jgi:chitin deacetylase
MRCQKLPELRPGTARMLAQPEDHSWPMQLMKRRVFILVLALAFMAAIIVGGMQLSRSRTYQVFGKIIPRVETTQRVVALTFDDGPTPKAVDALLPVLHSRDVKATFFVIGAELEKHPQLGARIVQEGHELGNHSYSHRRMVFKSLSFIDQEIRRTDQMIRSAGSEGRIYFRPPYGKKLLLLPYYLSEQRRPAITWDVEPESYPAIAQDTDKIVEHVLAHARPGSIILLHPMYRSNKPSLEAVAKIIDGMKQRGYRFVTVSELIDMEG